MKINIKSDKNSYILTKKKEIVKCLNFVLSGKDTMFVGKKFTTVTPYFDEPIDSTLIEVFEVQELSDTLYSWTFSEIKKKIMIFNMYGKNIAMPVIHTEI